MYQLSADHSTARGISANQLKTAVLDTVSDLNTEVLGPIDPEKRELFPECLRTIAHVE